MEPMAIERLTGHRLELDGYMTSLRVPYPRTRSHGDLDVLGFRPSDRRVVVCECKAWGAPENYPRYRVKDAPWIREALDELEQNYYSFVAGPTNSYGLTKRDKVSCWYVLPGAFDEELQAEMRSWPTHYRGLAIHELLRELFLQVQGDSIRRRKRYPDTALEMIRWLIRAHANGHFDLGEFAVALNRSKQTDRSRYLPYVENYVRSSVAAVLAGSRTESTRQKAMIGLLDLTTKNRTDVSIGDIERRLTELGIDWKANQVRVGLGTWEALGLVSRRTVGRKSVFTIPAAFVDPLAGCRELLVS